MIADWVLRYHSSQLAIMNHTWISIGVGYVIFSELDWLVGTVYCIQQVDKEFRGHQSGTFWADFYTWLKVCAAALLHVSSCNIILGCLWVLYRRRWLKEEGTDNVQLVVIFIADQVLFSATVAPKLHVMKWLSRRFLQSSKGFGRDARQWQYGKIF
jgi:hypothetical protein